jgi:hypothetical protein
MRKCSILVLLICIGFTSISSAQTNFHRYEFRNMSEIVAITENEFTSKVEMTISAKPFPAKTKVTYLGKRRKADTLTRDFIGLWAQSLNVQPGNVALLTDEFLFSEQGVEFWMPVHAKVVPGLEKAFKAGDEVVIYYFFLGGYTPARLIEKRTVAVGDLNDTSNVARWIFALETFDEPKPTTTTVSSFISQRLEAAIDRSLEKDIKDFWIDPRQVRSRWQMTFTGDTRPVDSGRRELLSRWLKFMNLSQVALELMVTEARFVDDDKEYWIPVRSSTLAAIEKQFKSGDKLLPHTILIGGRREKKSVDWVFLVGEFSQ